MASRIQRRPPGGCPTTRRSYIRRAETCGRPSGARSINRGLRMAASSISDVTIKDGAAIDIYRQRAAASIAQHGGRYIVRGGEIEVLEGAWRPRAIIIAEFPDMERARTWYRSAEYASALALRDEALSRNL